MTLTSFHQVRQLIQAAIEEDLGRGDVTTEATIGAQVISRARVITKQEIVLAGMDVFAEVYTALDGAVHLKPSGHDGDLLSAGAVVALLEGRARSLLAGERVALNFLQRLSGIATLTHQYVEAVRGYNVEIIDTRKTTPGWRLLEKYAVRVGGGKNHRHDLGDGVLIKDNHIVAAGGITAAVELARRHSHHLLKIEVEVETLEQVEEALQAGAEVIMLDHMSPALLAEGVKLIGKRALVEASGGVSLESVTAVARTGVDLILFEKLTHSAPAAELLRSAPEGRDGHHCTVERAPMRIEGVVWLNAIVDKLAVRHHVATHEVEEVLTNNPKFRFVERGQHQDEDIYMALGQTDAGRYVTVLFIYKTTAEALILSARDMADKERRQYGRK